MVEDCMIPKGSYLASSFMDKPHGVILQYLSFLSILNLEPFFFFQCGKSEVFSFINRAELIVTRASS